MPRKTHSDTQPIKQAAWFETTHWSLVLKAGHDSSPDSDDALARLCEVYWYPLYAYVRKRVGTVHDAQDLTQAFFARLIEKGFLHDVDKSCGKFRSFLLASIKHFIANEHKRDRAEKRGGGRQNLSLDFVPLDFEDAERRYCIEPIDTMTPELLYERRWALTLLDQVISRLEQEFEKSGKSVWFAALKPLLTAAPDAPSHREAANQLGSTEAAVKAAAHRLRRRCRTVLREEIAQTVTAPDQIEEEIQELFQSVSSEFFP
ncbi:Sigma-70 region 2 [Planctomycetes bacterium CA13]|uniref:Sigma-70 region 2 n=1 Tax=Novipirellula herctigrandis TaxID=2527986 RepID=A0A5C5YN67_9BACT|nr:Sigma-70 region 2 [Planctomycetes bacterium CA13]